MEGRKKRNYRTVKAWGVRLLALLTILATSYSLVMPGITRAAETYCDKEEHTHTADCPDPCLLDEHVHETQCYSNPEADTEEESDWIKSMDKADEMDASAEKLARIARSQIGYRESTDNYLVLDDGTKAGYTRYGQWSGHPYSEDWTADFMNFCLFYAGAPDVLDADGQIQDWYADAQGENRLKDDPEQVQPGDIVFFEQKDELKIGIVTDLNEKQIKAAAKSGSKVAELSVEKSELEQMYYSVLPAAVSGDQMTADFDDMDFFADDLQTDDAMAAVDGDLASPQEEENLPEKPVTLADCEFKTPFPADTISSQKLMYKNEKMTDWEEYSGQELDQNSMLAVRVVYRDLSVSQIENDEGKYTYDIPPLLKGVVVDASKGSPLKHKNETGPEVTIGHLTLCPDTLSAFHIYISNPGEIIGDKITEGNFTAEARVNLDEYYKTKNTKVTIGDKVYTLNIKSNAIDTGSSVSGFQKAKDSSKGTNVHSLDNGKFQIDDQIYFTTGPNPFPDAIVDDWITTNKEVAQFDPDSLELYIGSDSTPIQITERSYKLYVHSSLSPGSVDSDESAGYQIKNSFTYTNYSKAEKTHTVPDHGFSVYLGELQPNTKYTLKYSYIVDSTKMIGGNQNIRNNGKVSCNEVQKGTDYEDTPLNATLTLNKTQSSIQEDAEGNLILSYTVDVTAPKTNAYSFSDVQLADVLKMLPKEGDTVLGVYKDKFELMTETLSVQKNGTSTSIQFSNQSQTGSSQSEYSIDLGTLKPGDSVKLTYQVKLTKAIRETMALQKMDTLNFNNEASISRTSDSYPGKAYTVRSSTNTAVQGTDWIKKQQLKEISLEASTVSMVGGTVYDQSHTEVSGQSSFNLPAHSIGYEIRINENGTGNVLNAEFTDRLLIDNQPQDLFGYTGYMQVDIYSGSQIAGGQPVDTIFIQLPEGEGRFTFRPSDYPKINKLDEESREKGKNLSFKLRYYVHPVGSTSGVVLKNTVTGIGKVGVGTGNTETMNLNVTSEVSGWTASAKDIELEKIGVTVYEPENKETGYPYGRAIWMIRVSGSQIPKGMVIHDESIDPKNIDPKNKITARPRFLENAVVGVYKAPKTTFSTQPFNGFTNIQKSNNDSKDKDELKPYSYDDVYQALSGSKTIDKNSYRLTLGDRVNATKTYPAYGYSFDLEFLNSIPIDEQEEVYILIQSAVAIQSGASWHYNKDRFSYTFQNTASYRLGNQPLEGRTTGTINGRNYSVFRKDFGNVFLYRNKEINLIDRNTDSLFSSYTEYQKVKPALQSALTNILMDDQGVYIDWRLQTSSNSHDNYPYKGTFMLVDELNKDQKYVTCYLTKDDEDTSDPAHMPVIDRQNIIIKNIGDGKQKVWIPVKDIKESEKFTVHVVSKCTQISFDKLLSVADSSTGFYTHNNSLEVYCDGNQVGYAAASVQVNMMDVLAKTSPNLSEDEKSQFGETQKKYQIKLNPDGVDLIQGSDTITVLDTFNSRVLQIDPGTIEIINGNGSKIDPSTYNVSYTTPSSDGTQTMRIEGLPDNTSLTINYRASINVLPGQTVELVNKVSWEGLQGKKIPVKECKSSFSYTVGGSSTSSQTDQVQLEKIDRYHAATTLSGAVFDLYRQVNPEGDLSAEDSWEKVNTAVETESEGTCQISDLNYNVLYKLVETKAPEGYQLDSMPYYIYFEKSDAEGYSRPSNLPTDRIFLATHGEDRKIQIMNQKPRASLRIQKTFGDNTPVVPGDYLFGIYQNEYSSGQNWMRQVTLSIPANATGYEGSVTVGDLESGATYYVYELDPNTGKPVLNHGLYDDGIQTFQVSYPEGNSVTVSHDPAKAQPMQVVNSPEYRLPKTGGSGTAGYYLGSALCFAGIGLALILKRRSISSSI